MKLKKHSNVTSLKFEMVAVVVSLVVVKVKIEQVVGAFLFGQGLV